MRNPRASDSPPATSTIISTRSDSGAEAVVTRVVVLAVGAVGLCLALLFGLDVSVEDGDGELSFIKCNSTDTMRSLQIEDGQRFIIDPTESEESEESED